MNATKSITVIRWSCAVVFAACIAGLIVSSIAGNNEGWVLSIGMVGVGAAIVSIVVSLVTTERRIPVFSEVRAEGIERHIEALVAAGGDEDKIRTLVREAVDLGRGL